MDKPALQFFSFLWLNSCVCMPSLNPAVYQADSLPFISQGDVKAQVCDLPLAKRFGLAFFMYSVAICQSLLFLLPSGACTRSQPQGRGACVAEACWELGVPRASWGNPWVRCSQWPCSLRVGFLMNSVMQFVCFPLMSSKTLFWYSLCCFLPPAPSHAAHSSVLWIGWERNEPLWQHPTQLGKLDAH